VGNSLVRLDAITRIAEERIAGSTNTLVRVIHLTDGGFVTASAEEFDEVKRALVGQSSKLRKASAVKEVIH